MIIYICQMHFNVCPDYLDANKEIYMVKADMYVIDSHSIILGEYYYFQPNELCMSMMMLAHVLCIEEKC